MTTILVIATPSDTPTKYGYYWLKRFSKFAAKQGHKVILQKTPSLQTLYNALKTYNPRLVVANGHGGFKSLSVDNHILIGVKTYDAAINRKLLSQNPEWFRGRIVLLLTCNAGKELAFRLIDYGAQAVLGFREPFVFVSEEHSSPDRDKLAEPFFLSMLQPAIYLSLHRNFGEGCQAAHKAFAYYLQIAEQNGEETSAKYLNFDMLNLVCVGDMWSRV